MKILILNQHTNNHGDDIAAISMYDQLIEEYPGAKIEMIYNNPEGEVPIVDVIHNHSVNLTKKDGFAAVLYLISSLFPFNKITVGDKIKSLQKSIKKADLVLISPCGANIGIYKDWYFLFRILMAVREGKQPIFHLNTISNSGNFFFDYIANFTLKKCKIFVREEKSYLYLKNKFRFVELGVDTAYSLDTKKYYQHFQLLDKDLMNYGDYIVLIPAKFGNWHPDFKELENIDEKLIDKISSEIVEVANSLKKNIVLLPHLNGNQAEDEYLVNIENEIKENPNFTRDIFISTSVKNALHYYRVIEKSYMTISMRYHGVVLSTLALTPIISLAYENKMNEVSNYTKMKDYNINLLEYLKHEDLILQKSMEIEENRDQIIETLSGRQEYLSEKAKLPLNFIKKMHVHNMQ